MMKGNRLKPLLGLSILLAGILSSAYAAQNNNFSCPSPTEIKSTDFTSPSIWIGPPMPHSAKDEVGAGLGGTKVKEFLGAESAIVSHKQGWVCVYRSKGGMSVHEYQARIREILDSNRYLKKYLERVNQEFENAEPYLKNYPQDSAIGFVGYVSEEQPTVKKQ